MTTVIYRAARVITMDEQNPHAEAFAVRNGRFVAVGTFDEVIAKAGPEYQISHEFDDRVVVAGFIDQHLHPFLGATTLTTEVIAPEDWVLPREFHPAAASRDAYDDRLRAADARLPGGEWLFSWGFHALWHGEMSRARLDQLVGDRPTAVWQRSCHEWFLNTAALEAIGLSHEMTKGHGLATEQIDWDRGHFYENGWMVVLAKYLMPLFMTAKRMERGLTQLVEYLHMNGVTAINEPGIFWRTEPWDLYQTILGRPDVPFESTFLIEGRTQPVRGLEPHEFIEDARSQVARGVGDKVRVVDNQVKLFADGAIISQLMQMKDPYLDVQGLPDHDHHGEWIMAPEELKSVFDVYWDAEWQIHIHVNGDLGLEVLLDIVEDAHARRPRSDHRTVVVHFANSTEDQVERIASLGAIVSANPYYPVGFADKYSAYGLGPQRADSMVRAASVLRHGIHLSFHSDLPMCPSDPLLMASFAVNRRTPSGRVAGPEHRIGVHDALRGVTIEAAYSWRREHELGSISEGKIASVTVLDADPYDCDPRDIARCRVVATMFAGRVFPVPADLIEQRQRSVGSDAGCGHGEMFFDHGDHGCGCEVAAFLADHIGASGWAA